MQDAQQIEEQTMQRIAAAEARAAVAQNHSKLAADRRATTQTAITKFRLLGEILSVGRQMLEQRRATAQSADQPPPPSDMAALDQAIDEVDNIIDQVRTNLTRQEGALQAFHDLENTFQGEANQARGMGRGAEVAGGRAAALAARSGEIQTPPPPAPEPEAEAEGTGSLLDVLQGDDVEDQPIGAPQTTGKRPKGASRRKAE